MQYIEYLKSPERKQKVCKKRSTDNRCGICASKDNIDIHHLSYYNIFKEAMGDLRRLCRKCHYTLHKLEKEKIIIYKNKNNNSRRAIAKHQVKKHMGIANKNMFI